MILWDILNYIKYVTKINLAVFLVLFKCGYQKIENHVCGFH